MTLAISISPDAERRLASKASAEGVDVSTLAARLLESAVRSLDSTAGPESPLDPTRQLLKKWADEAKGFSRTDMEQGEQEFEELQKSMNASRRESEGPDARTPFP